MRSPSHSYIDPAIYCIKVSGCLADHWSDWFDGLTIIADPEHEETVIAGWVRDQAALHGLLTKIRDLGLPLLALQRQETEDQ